MFYSSGSEVDMYLACERKHWYAFGKKHNPTANPGLQSIRHSDNLTRGTVGHSVIENYYTFIKEGMARDGAFLKARDIHIAAMGENPDRAELYQHVLKMFIEYHTKYFNESFEPLVLEHEFQYQISDDVMIVIKPDGVFKDASTGKIHIVDHKLLYRFYQERTYPILPQMLRYAAVLKRLGYPVHKTTYNMLCTDPRIKTENMFKRHHQDLELPNIQRKMEQFWTEAVGVMQDIAAIKQVDLERPGTWERTARRNASSFTCTNCPFLELCAADAEQQNGIDLMIQAYYEPNKYGYGREEEVA